MVNGTQAKGVEARVAELTAAGLKASGAAFDVTDRAAAAAALARIERELGGLDILVNNAGVTKRQPVLEVTAEDWQRIIDIDLTACFHLAQLGAAIMMKQTPSGGRIIMIASAIGLVGRAEIAAYAAAKRSHRPHARCSPREPGPRAFSATLWRPASSPPTLRPHF